MGTYIGSPWGFILGKLGDTVGGKWRGINWNRVRVKPTQRGTLDQYRLWKDDPAGHPFFSLAQMNIRRAVLQVLGYIARSGDALPKWIYPVWEALVIKRGWTMTGSNAFIRRNAATLLSSMDRDLEFEPGVNEPDLAQMLVADGDLEAPAGIGPVTYDPPTGALLVNWNPAIFTNGSGDDIAYFLIAKKPLLESVGRDGTWYPKLYMYTIMTYPPPPGIATTRGDGSVTIQLPIGLDATDLVAYLFFRDSADAIGYSPSLGMQATV